MRNEDMNSTQFYFIRTIKSHYYLNGSGQYSTPKLYKEGDAKRVVKMKNRGYIHPDDGGFEMVPVRLIIGDFNENIEGE